MSDEQIARIYDPMASSTASVLVQSRRIAYLQQRVRSQTTVCARGGGGPAAAPTLRGTRIWVPKEPEDDADPPQAISVPGIWEATIA